MYYILSVIIAAIISSSFLELDFDVFIIALSVTFSFAAGNVINDIIDFETDKINRPERVLPKELLTIAFAKGLFVFLFIVSITLPFLVSIVFVVILFALNLLLLLYSTHLKKAPLLSNLVVAFATAVPLVLGGLAMDNIQGGLIPAGFAFFTNFIREIIKDIEDIKGDSSIGVKTFPQIAGVKTTVHFSALLIILLIILATFPYVYGIYNVEYFLIIMVVVNPILVYALKLIYSSLTLVTIRKISNLLKGSMIFGLFAILIGAQ
ncbi:MAG: geranylgeranylglycerol-phosphate geranylgeranyltransferase [Melioribacteraceae bacterium]|nr:geranylgeranylglycerol-phosphate geranylgeranyltransferase [Melioribacteraceae bacterium]